MKMTWWSKLSIICFFLGISCWIPNLFFYHSDNPPIFILLTPIIGGVGIVLALKEKKEVVKGILMFMNLTVTLSFGLVFLVGTLLFGP
ncbi:hypothetical protein [Vagococcus hydrophili]|uniref:Uncharacterized protein n=1 Tax=Vagococcus hydrophili TaxID=2714947 RepID=A0A6G8ARP9_9ENTE|nr:hypothetical protein [Vagococcus hydrophili]QIL47676.1 hypothetical protein G7082_03550 [Vagococcus hydrophili]